MGRSEIGKDLTQGSIPLQLIGFIGPLFFSNVLQTVYNVVDMIVVGRFVGNAGLSAVSVSSDVIHILTFAAMGFANAGQVLIAQRIGAGRRDQVRLLIGNLFSLVLCIAVFVSAMCLIFRDSILSFINTPPQALADAQIYLTVCGAGLVFTYGYNAVSATLRGRGDSKRPFVFVTITSVLNIVLDLLLVAVFRLGVLGAAVATVFSQAVSFAVSIVYLVRNRDRFGFDFRRESFAFHAPTLGVLVRLGIPMALQSGFIQGSKLVTGRWVNAYGVNVSAITGVGGKFNSIAMAFAGAVSAASAAMIGQCIGAKKYERVGRTIWVGALLALVTSVLMSAAVFFFPRATFGLFTDEPAILDMTAVYAPVVVVMLIASALRAPMNGLINGSGHARLNFLLAILDGIVGHIGLTALLGFGFGLGLPGLWYGNAMAGLIPLAVGLIYFFSGRWKQAVRFRGDAR